MPRSRLIIRQLDKEAVGLAYILSWSCGLLITTMLAVSQVSAQVQDEDVIRVDVGLVTINVAVKDKKGHPVLGLKAQDFLVADENKPVVPQFFDNGGPASIVFVVDTSSSMLGTKWRNLMAGLKTFLKHANAENDYTLVAFADNTRLLAQSINGTELLKQLSGLHPGGETVLYDGVLLGLVALERASQRHKALVLISDGQDTSSRAGLAEIEKETLARHATIYAVGILLNQSCKTFNQDACHGKEIIERLAKVTGGLGQFPDSDELAGALKAINSDIISQYSLSYYAPDKRPGWRRVEVTVAQNVHDSLRYQQRYLMR
ncbi:MAG: hypothetical protein C5B55_12895 [Blastocatellia bacterium]|nr:MAG: hypothetical protein C5B55_12895 [Blastocatellia bacterium]